MKNLRALAMFSVALWTIAGCSQEEPEFLAGGREVESWVAALRDPDPLLRRQAVMKLGNVSDADPAAAEALTEALLDTDVQVRRAAVFAVVKLKDPSEAITAQLDTMSRTDEDADVRDIAGRALKHLAKSD